MENRVELELRITLPWSQENFFISRKPQILLFDPIVYGVCLCDQEL